MNGRYRLLIELGVEDGRPHILAQTLERLEEEAPAEAAGNKEEERVVEGATESDLDFSVVEGPKLRYAGVALVAALALVGGYQVLPRDVKEAPVRALQDGERSAESTVGQNNNEAIAARTRAVTNKGGASVAIEELEHLIVEENQYGDSDLHAALAHALVRADRGADALQHFAMVIKNEPRVLTDTDVNELVGQLILPKKDGERAMELAVALGDRAIPVLKDVAEDQLADKMMRVRAQKALRQLKQLPRLVRPDEDRM